MNIKTNIIFIKHIYLIDNQQLKKNVNKVIFSMLKYMDYFVFYF